MAAAVALVATAALAVPPGTERVTDERRTPLPEALSDFACSGGMAGAFPCHGVDLLAFVPVGAMGCGTGNDIWGWTDPVTGTEYALMGCNNGTSFLDLSDPTSPVYVGRLPTHTVNSLWRDIKVYGDHAFIVSEATGHGLQVFDLGQLREVVAPPVVFQATAHNASFGHSHNIAISEETGYAYVVGSNVCSGGLHILDIGTPISPQVAGCFAADGYTHDTQCVIYRGPDSRHREREICFNSNANTLTLVDVTEKSAPVMLGRETYPGVGYTHQGWLTEDHHYFLLDDELDELQQGHNTRTRIWDVSDLEAPVIIGVFESAVPATDHNQYVKGNHVFQSNYTAGLRILDLTEVADGVLTEVAFFDTFPAHDNPGFSGSWSNYPFFESGIVIVSTIDEGLFVVLPQLVPVEIEGTVTRSDTGAPLAGALVEALASIGYSATSNADGTYRVEVLPGTYDLVASREGFFPETVSGIEVLPGSTVVVDFTLAPIPVASISPPGFEITIPQGTGTSELLEVANLGEGALSWVIATDLPSFDSRLRSHDPSLDEPIAIPDFQITPGAFVDFSFPAGVGAQGQVVGFHFVGTVTGIGGNSTWASDMCLILESPGGSTYAVGGFSGSQAGCSVNDWGFQGGGSTGNGTYQSTHDGVFPEVGDAGNWSFRFVHDWTGSPATMSWSDVTVTLLKEALPICAEATEVPWLSTDPEQGLTPPGGGDTVEVAVNASELEIGEYRAFLCFQSNDPTAPVIVVDVSLTVTEPAPIAAISPGTLDFEVLEGEVGSDLLTVGNVGSADLEWDLELAEPGAGCASPAPPEWLDAAPLAGSNEPGFSTPVLVSVNATALRAGEYHGLLCFGTNDPAQPLIEVPVTLTVLDPCPNAGQLVLEGQIVGGIEVFEACVSITAGNGFTVSSTGQVTFRAGQRVVLSDGFTVETGGSLTAEIDPELLP